MGCSMLFRCQLCMRVVPPGTRAARVVLATRPKVYPFRAHAMREISKEDKKPKHNRGGVGREIVREALVCPACAAAGRVPDFCPDTRGDRSVT